MGWSALSARMCVAPNWEQQWTHWRRGVLFRETWTGWRNGLSRTSFNSARASMIFASLKGPHAAEQAADAALQKSVKYCNRVPTKVKESLSPEVLKTQLDTVLCNLIYLDLFSAKDQTSYPLKVPSMLNFGSVPLCCLLYRAFCVHEDFEECSILKTYISLRNYYA